MSQIQFIFKSGDNVKSFPEPISGRYELSKLVIEAESLTNLAKAVRSMRLYFRFDFGSTYHNHSKTFHLSDYILGMDSLTYTIDFEREIIDLTKKSQCNNAVASVLDDVIHPVNKMTLILNHFESKSE